jgi:viroplasmin and RNaseH domain-containing protein
MTRWYVVFVGSAPGLYENWDAAKVVVEGHSGNKHSWFPSREDALAAYNYFQDTGIVVSR